MRKCLILSAALLLLALNPNPAAIAEPDVPAEPKTGPTDAWPFTEAAPDWEESWKLCTEALEGDEAALKQVEDARVTYAPLLLGRADGRELGYELLRRDIDWLRAMQGWEHTLMRVDSAAVMQAWTELRGRFRDPEPQLARAILHAWTNGDRATLDALVKLQPDSGWVKGALAFTGGFYPERESITILIGLLKQLAAAGYWSMHVSPNQLLPDGRRPRLNDMRADRELTLASLGEQDGLRDIDNFPREFSENGLTERIGALTADLPDYDAIEKVKGELADAIPAGMDKVSSLDTFVLSAFIDHSDFSQVDRVFLVNNAARSRGTSLIPYSIYALPPEHEAERLSATITAFAGMPDRTITQRALLARALEAGDEVLVRLAARAVMALAGDNLDSYRNILRAFYRADRMPELRELYRKALLDSGSAELKELAELVKEGKWEVLNPRDRRKLTLSDKQKAALLKPFTHEQERKLHGGELAVYWLNRAVFSEGARAVHAAGGYYIEAIHAATGGKPGGAMSPNVYQYLMFRWRNLDDASRPAHDAMLTARGEEFAKQVLALEAGLHDADAGPEKNAPMTAWLLWMAKTDPLAEKVTTELKDHPERWGGAGLIAAARTAFYAGDMEGFRRLRDQAAQASPLDFDVYYQMTSRNERVGTCSFSNWEAVSRNVWRLALLHPTCTQTPGFLGVLALRSGQDGWAACAATCLAHLRPPYLHRGDVNFFQYMYRLAGRNWTSRFLLRYATVSNELITGQAREMLKQAFEVPTYLWNAYTILDYLRSYGASFNFTLNNLETCVSIFDMQNVSNLLDLARHMGRIDPARAIEFVAKADQLGVSRYGRFVGTQTWVEAHGRLGTLDQEWERYDDMRGGRVGVPHYLDTFMLAGITGGNQYKLLDKAIEKITGYGGVAEDNTYCLFYWRRAHMALGKHAEVRAIPVGPDTPAFPYESYKDFTRLFHEARGILDAGSFELLAHRADPYLDKYIEGGVGEYADAAILKALAWKELDDPEFDPFQCVPDALIDRLSERGRVLDCAVLEILAGKRETRTLPQADKDNYWHGSRWCERVAGYLGEGRISPAEVQARDPFIRGALAYLAGDKAEARKQLQACMDADQRCSHEYHVAQWLLENRLKE